MSVELVLLLLIPGFVALSAAIVAGYWLVTTRAGRWTWWPWR